MLCDRAFKFLSGTVSWMLLPDGKRKIKSPALNLAGPLLFAVQRFLKARQDSMKLI